jgi:RNA polymerase-binding protein DksA
MKKKTKASKPAKKAPAKKTTSKKAVKKTAPKKAAPKKAAKKTAAAKKVAPKKTVAKKAAPKKVAKKAAAAKKVPAKKAAAATKKSAPKLERAVVTTVLPPKLGTSLSSKSGLPAQAAVKAPKAPQAKLAAAPVAANTRKRLNKEELKYFENLLNEKKETLLQEQSYLEDNALRLNSKDGAGDLSSHAYHLADHATETQDREQAFHLASREGKFLFYIEEALDRVRAGTFGICKKCGTLIPKARLEAVPTAKMCINCKSQQEHAVIEDAAAS